MENLEIIIKESHSWNEVSRKIYGYKGSWQTNKIRTIVIKQNIDFSHFVKVIRYPKLIKSCPICGNDFNTKKGPNEKYTCSHSCANTQFRSKIVIKDYRKRALKYYNNKCKVCLEDRLHVLQIHHKDENRNNNDILNLEILCANCHLDLHYKIKK